MPRKHYSSVGFAPDTVSKLDAIATERKISRAEVIRELVEQGLKGPAQYENIHPDMGEIRTMFREIISEEFQRHARVYHRDEKQPFKPLEPVEVRRAKAHRFEIEPNMVDILNRIQTELNRNIEPALVDVAPNVSPWLVGTELRKLGITPKEKMVNSVRKTRIPLSERDKIKRLLDQS